MTKAPTNIAASVRARLLHVATQRGEDFQAVLTRYASERLLYRLSQSPHADRFVLKGATLFTIWTHEPHWATGDVDLLGFGEPTAAAVEQLFTDILAPQSQINASMANERRNRIAHDILRCRCSSVPSGGGRLRLAGAKLVMNARQRALGAN